MPNGQQLNKSFPRSFADDDTMAGYKLNFYWKVTRELILLLLILEIVIMIVNQYLWLHWVAEALVFIILSWVLIKKYKVRLNTIMAASVYLGIIVGLLLTIFEIIWYHKWWYLLDFIRLPILLSLVGIVITVIFTLIFLNIIKKDKVLTSKGGEEIWMKK